MTIRNLFSLIIMLQGLKLENLAVSYTLEGLVR